MIAAGWGTDWPFVAAPFVFYFFTVFWLLVMGDHGDERNVVRAFFKRISFSLEKFTGYPGWCMAGALSGLLVLAVAVMGLYWDVAWHIDLGRDKDLFNPSHTMILLGLGGMVYASVIAVIFATNDGADVGFRFAGLRIPRSALMFAVLGVGGAAAFPLDELWHRAYGIDITLWSPSHLMLVAGGSLGPIALMLMILEGRRNARPTPLGHIIHATTAGAVMVGLSTFQGEFDFGVPQFQALYLPVLFALAMGFGLVLNRMAMGPGGALYAVVAYLVLRGAIGALVAGGLNHSFPRFPLYIGGALCVEAVALLVGTRRTLRFAIASGAAIGLVGLALEFAWVDASGWFDVRPGALALPGTVLGLVAAMAAAVVGAGLGRAWRHGLAEDTDPVPGAALGIAAAAVIVSLAIPLPRNVGDVDAVIRTQPEGELARVAVELIPADAAEDATAFGIMSWQGGGRNWSELREVAPGRFESEEAVPVTGNWKSMVSLMRGSQVMAAAIYMPADPEIGASAVPAVPERRVAFERNTSILLREAKDGPAWPAMAAYAGVGLVTLLWVALFAFTGRRLADGEGEGDRPGQAPFPYAGPSEPPAWQPRTAVRSGTRGGP